MTSLFGRSWWGLALRGLLSILFGIALFVRPDLGLLALIVLVGAYFLVDGVLALFNAFRVQAGHRRWWALLLEGLLGIAVGLITLVWPGVTATTLIYLIAAWAIVTGVLEIISAIRYAKEMENEWLLVVAGIASVVFGIFMAINPGAGITAVMWVIGAYAILFGALLIVAGLRARSYADDTPVTRTA